MGVPFRLISKKCDGRISKKGDGQISNKHDGRICKEHDGWVPQEGPSGQLVKNVTDGLVKIGADEVLTML